MKKNYYSDLREKWSLQKQQLNNTRQDTDRERRLAFQNYYTIKCGDEVSEGTRELQDLERKRVRAQTTQALQNARADEDEELESWSDHYTNVKLTRQQADEVNKTIQQKKLQDVQASWIEHKKSIADYNQTYFPARKAERTQQDIEYAEQRKVADAKLAEEWQKRATAQREAFETYMRARDERIAKEQEKKRQDREAALLKKQQERDVAAAARQDFNAHYYENSKQQRATDDAVLATTRAKAKEDLQQARQDFDSAYDKNSAWKNYRAKKLADRAVEDTLIQTAWSNYAADFKTRASSKWQATTAIRSTYNSKVKTERVAEDEQRTVRYDAANVALTKSNQEYRTAHSDYVTKKITDRISARESADILNAANRIGAQGQRAINQSQELAQRLHPIGYVVVVDGLRKQAVSNRSAARAQSRLNRSLEWRHQLEAQNAWIKEYYLNKKAVRNKADSELLKHRDDSTAKRASIRSQYQADNSAYLNNYFEVRNTKRIETLTTRNNTRIQATDRRALDRNAAIVDLKATRDEYDTQWKGRHNAQYQQYEVDIRTLRNNGYSHLARNKSISMKIRKSWRATMNVGLEAQRSAYDLITGSWFNLNETGIAIGNNLYDVGSFAYFNLSGLEYYVLSTYANLVYPLATRSYDAGVYSVHFARDSVVCLARHVIRDRLHDLAVAGSVIWLPVSWTASNFMLERGRNIADATRFTAHMIYYISAVAGITAYNRYVPVRQFVSNRVVNGGYLASDICRFSGRALADTGFAIYRVSMAAYIPISEFMLNRAVGVKRSLKWLARKAKHTASDTANNLYAAGSYAYFPLRFGGEFGCKYVYKSLASVVRFKARLGRDIGQLGYIAWCNSAIPVFRLIHDGTVSLGQLIKDGSIGSVRFGRDRAHDLKVILWDNIIIQITRKMLDCSNALLILVGATIAASYRGLEYGCSLSTAIFSKMFSSSIKQISKGTRTLGHYTYTGAKATARFMHDRKHTSGRAINCIWLPSGEFMHTSAIVTWQSVRNGAVCLARATDDYCFYPIIFMAKRGYTEASRAGWDAGVAAGRAMQDAATASVRTAHDFSFEVHKRCDQPLINSARCAYDSGIAVAHEVEVFAKKTYDFVADLSPLQWLEKGADQRLQELRTQRDDDTPLDSATNMNLSLA